ncbi:MAG: hypothetical protein ACE5Z5_03960 [Candidatus Bathyarchaeia archaeon]
MRALPDDALFDILRYWVIPILTFLALVMAFLYVTYGRERTAR